MKAESGQVYDAIETDNIKLTQMIKENWRKGNFVKQRKKVLDNFELVPKAFGK